MSLLTTVQKRLLSLAARLAFLGPTLARLTLGIVFVATGWGKLLARSPRPATTARIATV